MILQFQSWAYIQEKHNFKRYIDPSIHCSMIYSHQDMKQPKYPMVDE